MTSVGSWHWQWTVLGAVYGIALRVLFGMLPSPYLGPMSIAFLIGTPFVVGALTIYGLRDAPQSLASWIFRPWASIALMLLGCAIALLEGLICLALMAPLFLLCASIGGLLMGVLLRFKPPKPSQLGVFAALPFLLLAGETQVPLSVSQQEIRQSIEIDAPPQRVWSEILTARDITAQELPLSFTHLIGVPKPVEGVNVHTPEGEIRFSRWQRGVNFRALVVARKEHESITWRYAFNVHSFPPGTMDEHVEIGGRYFDLQDTSFNLSPLGEGRTRLEIVAHYRVTSSINLYAVPVARLLGHDFIHTILVLYKGRSER
jgi:hypothetical protein